MALRTAPPFRADHVGRLLRPPPDDELRGIEDEAIRDVIRRQEEVGLRSATDGEFRRASWSIDFIYALGGIEQAGDDRSAASRPPSTATPSATSSQWAKLRLVVETAEEVWG